MSGIWGSIQGAFDDYVLPVAHMAGGAIETLAHGSAAARAVPAIGAYVGLAQAALHGTQAVLAPSNSDERWDHIGAAALGALGAIPAVGAYVGAGELGWNVGGSIASGGMHANEESGFNANQMLGGLMRATIQSPVASAVAGGVEGMAGGPIGMLMGAFGGWGASQGATALGVGNQPNGQQYGFGNIFDRARAYDSRGAE